MHVTWSKTTSSLLALVIDEEVTKTDTSFLATPDKCLYSGLFYYVMSLMLPNVQLLIFFFFFYPLELSVVLTPVAGVKFRFLSCLSFCQFFFFFFRAFSEKSSCSVCEEADDFDSKGFDLGSSTLGSFIEKPWVWASVVV